MMPSWSNVMVSVMMSKVEERPRLVTAGYGRHRSQLVKGLLSIVLINNEDNRALISQAYA